MKTPCDNVEFVSYSGSYPNLCSGNLVLKIDGELVNLGRCLCSGGSVWFDDYCSEHIEEGEWSVDVPEQYKHLEDEITAVVNENVEYGCCGGCV